MLKRDVKLQPTYTPCFVPVCRCLSQKCWTASPPRQHGCACRLSAVTTPVSVRAGRLPDDVTWPRPFGHPVTAVTSTCPLHRRRAVVTIPRNNGRVKEDLLSIDFDSCALCSELNKKVWPPSTDTLCRPLGRYFTRPPDDIFGISETDVPFKN